MVVRGRDEAGGYFDAASDPRKGGRPAGPTSHSDPSDPVVFRPPFSFRHSGD